MSIYRRVQQSNVIRTIHQYQTLDENNAQAPMTPFEFVAVFFSVVLGLGVTHFLSTLSNLLEARDRVRMSWPHTVWAVAVLLLLIHSWWGMWALREVEGWPYAGFLSIVAYLAALYVLSTLLFPRIRDEGTIDLWQHHMSVRPMFHVTFALVLLMAGMINHTMFAVPISSPFVFVPFLCSAAGIVGVTTSNRHYHRFIAVAFLMFVLAMMISDETVLR